MLASLMLITLIGLGVVALCCGAISAAIAGANSLNPRTWFFWGLVGGTIALLTLVVMTKPWLSGESVA